MYFMCPVSLGFFAPCFLRPEYGDVFFSPDSVDVFGDYSGTSS